MTLDSEKGEYLLCVCSFLGRGSLFTVQYSFWLSSEAKLIEYRVL